MRGLRRRHALRLPLLLKGPTGCGKTRFVSHMAARLGRPLHTVACHDDLSAADLIGRYLLKGGETVWVDGPLTRAVREGAICYLDEVVEARKDVTVVLHPLTDDRRILPIDRTGEELLAAPPNFMLVASYNPGYQNILKTLKPSTRQRFVDRVRFPAARAGNRDRRDGKRPAGRPRRPLVRLAGKLRGLKGQDLEEGVSTRLLVYCASLIHQGMPVDRAVRVAMIEPLADDEDVKRGLSGYRHRRPGLKALACPVSSFELWEPEETVGKLWHAIASRLDAPEILRGGRGRTGRGARTPCGLLPRRGRQRPGRDRQAPPEASCTVFPSPRPGRVEERMARASLDGEALRLPRADCRSSQRDANLSLFFWLAADRGHAPDLRSRRPIRCAPICARWRAASRMIGNGGRLPGPAADLRCAGRGMRAGASETDAAALGKRGRGTIMASAGRRCAVPGDLAGRLLFARFVRRCGPNGPPRRAAIARSCRCRCGRTCGR